MVEHQFDIAGRLIWWELAERSDRASLVAGLDAIGLRKLAPEEPSPVACLREAITRSIKTAQHLVVPIKHRNGFTVQLKDHTDELHTQVVQSLVCWIEPDSLRVHFDPLDERADKVVSAYNEMLGVVDLAKVSGCIVRALNLHGQDSAITMRSHGGLYWLHERHVPEFKQFADVVQACGTSGQNVIHMATVQADADALRAICAAAQREAQATLEEADKLYNEANDATLELGERALSNRSEKAVQLLRRMQHFKEAFGLDVQAAEAALVKSADACQLAAMAAHMASQTAQLQEVA